MNQDSVVTNIFANLIPFVDYYYPIVMPLIVYNILSYIYVINFISLFKSLILELKYLE